MKSTTTQGRANPHAVSCKLLTVLVFCAIVVYAQSANADDTRSIAIIGGSALVSYADSTGNMRSSTSGAVQAQVSQMKNYETTQTSVKPASPNQQVHSGTKASDSHTGIANVQVGSLAGR